MKLTSNKEIQKARDAYFSVFQNRSPYRAPFREDTAVRAMIYPVDTYPDDDLYFAIANAVSEIGEDEAYFSTIMTVTEDSYFAVDFWKLDLDEYPFNDKGMRENGWIALLESTIYSIEGDWGVILTNKQFGLVGGSNPFMDGLRRWVHDLDSQVVRFVDQYWYARQSPGGNSAWLPSLLAHVYGEEKAALLLREH